MIPRLKRQTKRRHSVQRAGWSIRWKGADGYWHTTYPRWRSVTVQSGPRTFSIDDWLSTDVFDSDISVAGTFTPDDRHP